VLLLAPVLLLLSIVPSKVPWMVIALFPAWATLAALPMAWVSAAGFSSSRERELEESHGDAEAHPISTVDASSKSWIHATRLVLTVAIVIAAVATTGSRAYEPLLRQIAESQWRGASFSRESANALNDLAKDGDRALITSFYYWKGIPSGHPDPIFACYLTKKIDVLIRPHQRPFSDVISDIKEYRLDWALLSPEPGPAASELFGKFQTELGLEPHKLSGAWLYNTKSVEKVKGER